MHTRSSCNFGPRPTAAAATIVIATHTSHQSILIHITRMFTIGMFCEFR
jgi:hypothetical protein